jgi:outer membrane protein assembly factor BamB
VNAEFPEAVRERILKAVPDTIKVGKDTLVCLDAQSGKTLWKFENEGKPTGRRTSGTPAVVDGRVFSVGSTHLYCVNAEDGKLVWKAALTGSGSSPLVEGGKVFLQAGGVACYSAADGKVLWTSKDAKGDTGSPVLWHTSDERTTLVCNTQRSLLGLDPATGEKRWEVEGGGQSSPVIDGDRLVIFSGAKDVGLRCYLAQKDAAPKVAWSHWWMSRRYTGSPIIHEGHVYLMCGGKHQCVSLSDGAVKWQTDVESTITSPMLVDGKFLVVEQNGSFLRLIKADPTSYQLLGRSKIGAMWCPTPAPNDGRLIVRKKNSVACFDLRPKP